MHAVTTHLPRPPARDLTEGLGVRRAWGSISPLLLAGCMASGNLLPLSGPGASVLLSVKRREVSVR